LTSESNFDSAATNNYNS